MKKVIDGNWDFFAEVASLERSAALADGGEENASRTGNLTAIPAVITPADAKEELSRMCLWEYARECAPLCAAIAKLHDVIGNLLGLVSRQDCAPHTVKAVDERLLPLVPANRALLAAPGSKRYRALPKRLKARAQSYRDLAQQWSQLLAPIELTVGRFNWRFLCSPDFPGKPWLDSSSGCKIKRSGTLFVDKSIYSGPKKVTVKHFGKSREQRAVPLPARFSGDFAAYFERNDKTEVKKFEQFILGMMKEQFEEFEKAGFECWIFPSEAFEIFSPEEISVGVRRMCHLRNPKRLVPNNVNDDEFRRETPAVYLRWLGVMRFFHLHGRQARQDVIERLERGDGRETARILKPYVDSEGSRDGEPRRDATNFYCRLLNQPSGSKPRSYSRFEKSQPAG